MASLCFRLFFKRFFLWDGQAGPDSDVSGDLIRDAFPHLAWNRRDDSLIRSTCRARRRNSAVSVSRWWPASWPTDDAMRLGHVQRSFRVYPTDGASILQLRQLPFQLLGPSNSDLRARSPCDRWWWMLRWTGLSAHLPGGVLITKLLYAFRTGLCTLYKLYCMTRLYVKML